MALARQCGARALVLLAGGNLRALVALLCLGLAAQATLTGVLAPVRQWLQGWGVVVAKVEAGNASVPIIDLGPEQIIERFTRSALSAEPS